MKINNKKSQDFLTGTTIFLVVNILFFGLMIFFVTRVGEGTASFEKNEAKKICLAVDQMNSGTELIVSLDEVYKKAENNNFQGTVVFPDYNTNKITVQITGKGGSSFDCFTKLDPGTISLNEQAKKLIIKT